jgi:hypothetical protein
VSREIADDFPGSFPLLQRGTFLQTKSGWAAAVAERTLLNLKYVGEWHSHLSAQTDMSDVDKIAMKEISGEMAKEGLPGLMLIIGDGGSYTIHLAEN